MALPYRLILFDCVNTLYLPDASRRPVLEIDGVAQTSTAPLVAERLAARLPGLDAVALHKVQRASWRWAESQRGGEHREIPAAARFRRVLEELGLPPEEPLVEELMRVHYDAVVGTFDLPEAHVRLLDELRGRFRLALFSNFDHAPPIAERLERDGLAAWLDPILISADLGWRKPGPRPSASRWSGWARRRSASCSWATPSATMSSARARRGWIARGSTCTARPLRRVPNRRSRWARWRNSARF